MKSTHDEILEKINLAKRGSLFFVDDFLSFGNAKAVSKALERLVQTEKLHRVARGIYSRLIEDPILGPIQPSTEAIAEAISRRDKARIIPSGSLALNALGLSTQIPLNVVYYTDGSARKINLGKRNIIFKKTSPKNLATIGSISTLVIQALKEIGRGKVTEDEIKIIIEYLRREEPSHLEHDIKLAPEWIRIIMRKALKTKK